MGLLKTATRAAVASSVHGRVQRRQNARWAQQEQAVAPVPPSPVAAPQPVAAPPATPAPRPTDTRQQLELLTQLGELRKAGVLTEAEFAAKKAEILGG